MTDRVAAPAGTRPFCEIAVVNGVRIQADSVYLDVTIMPGRWDASVRLLSVYTGGGYGMIAVPRTGDEVLVIFPGGMINSGIAVWGLYNGTDTPPDGGREDLILIEGRPGDNLRVTIRGRADLTVDGDVNLTTGGDNTSETAGDTVRRTAGDDLQNVDGDKDIIVQGNASRACFGSETDTVLLSREKTTGGSDTETTGLIKTVTATTVVINALGAFTLSHAGAPVMSFTGGGNVVFHRHVNFTAGTSGDQT